MENIFSLVILICWIVFWVYWIVSAVGKKKVSRTVGGVWRVVITIALIAVAFGASWQTYFAAQIIPKTAAFGIIGDVLCVLGIAFAIWARRHLGTNWNSQPSVQEGHELVTSGPYRFVRHPIYTGMALALIGSAFAVGQLSWLIIYVALIVMFIWRIHVEERFMTETFPDQYPEYKKRTKALIPFIW